jgi:septum formation protein
MGINTDFQLVLGSASPRRRSLLAVLGLPFSVQVPGIDETPQDGESALAYVQRNANEKASAIAAARPANSQNEVIITSDTEVVFEGEIFGKPKDATDAVEMLKRLRGQTHDVVTGVAVLDTQTGQLHAALCQGPVPMRSYTDTEIDDYVATGDPLDKAGAYAIQNDVFNPVEAFSHCYASVMGLPLCHLSRTLQQMGIYPSTNVPEACQTLLQYDCPVYREILNDAETQ